MIGFQLCLGSLQQLQAVVLGCWCGWLRPWHAWCDWVAWSHVLSYLVVVVFYRAYILLVDLVFHQRWCAFGSFQEISTLVYGFGPGLKSALGEEAPSVTLILDHVWRIVVSWLVELLSILSSRVCHRRPSFKPAVEEVGWNRLLWFHPIHLLGRDHRRCMLHGWRQRRRLRHLWSDLKPQLFGWWDWNPLFLDALVHLRPCLTCLLYLCFWIFFEEVGLFALRFRRQLFAYASFWAEFVQNWLSCRSMVSEHYFGFLSEFQGRQKKVALCTFLIGRLVTCWGFFDVDFHYFTLVLDVDLGFGCWRSLLFRAPIWSVLRLRIIFGPFDRFLLSRLESYQPVYQLILCEVLRSHFEYRVILLIFKFGPLNPTSWSHRFNLRCASVWLRSTQ